MKKLLTVALFVAMALLLTQVEVASANGGPHGGYTATTDACAGCHRAHTAIGPRLLVDTSTYALCMTCHNNAGTGADTNVEDGFFLSTRSASTEGEANTADNAPLLGGGFLNYQGAAVTSTHDPTGVADNPWGFGVNRGVAGGAMPDGLLDCASCHDPHGSTNYRIINETINGTIVVVPQVDELPANKDYDTEQWDADPVAGTGPSYLCEACHNAYHRTNAGQGSIIDAGTYTHRVDMSYAYGGNLNPDTVGFGGFNLPLADDTDAAVNNDLVVCMTCHLPHGSSAVMAGIADGGPTGGGTVPGDTTATDSALLRLDNRGVCEVCHQK